MENRCAHVERTLCNAKGKPQRINVPAQRLVKSGLRACGLKRLHHASDRIVLEHGTGRRRNEVLLLNPQNSGRSIFERERRLIRERPESGNPE